MLAIVNSSAVECVYLFELEFSSFLDIGPGVGFLDHIAALFLVSQGISMQFPIVIAPIYIPTSSVGGFPFCHTFSGICYLQMMAILTGVR